MIAKIYKLRFTGGVHFGEGTLDSSARTFRADTLFSALCLEALKAGRLGDLVRLAESGRLLFSDALPFDSKRLYVPKPLDRPVIPKGQEQEVSKRKKFKKLEFVPVRMLGEYMKGRLDPDHVRTSFGVSSAYEKVSMRTDGDDPRPYRVGAFRFDTLNDCGLYVIALAETEEIMRLSGSLLEALSFSGIGGKRSSGFGKFTVEEDDPAEVCPDLASHIKAPMDCAAGKRLMLMSTALPDDDSLGEVLDGANYLLEKRSGFAAPEDGTESLKKKDLFVFKAGSCFAHSFTGTIRDVSKGTPHPVYRYAKAMFWEM